LHQGAAGVRWGDPLNARRTAVLTKFLLGLTLVAVPAIGIVAYRAGYEQGRSEGYFEGRRPDFCSDFLEKCPYQETIDWYKQQFKPDAVFDAPKSDGRVMMTRRLPGDRHEWQGEAQLSLTPKGDGWEVEYLHRNYNTHPVENPGGVIIRRRAEERRAAGLPPEVQ
jgi:hypothetical protein